MSTLSHQVMQLFYIYIEINPILTHLRDELFIYGIMN